MKRLVLLFLGTALLSGGQSRGGSLLYSNGFVSVNDGTAISVSPGPVTNSFKLSSDATLTEAQIGVWATTGASNTPRTVDWSIGTSAFGSDVSSGAARS